MEESVSCMLEMAEKFEDMVKECKLIADTNILIEKCVFTHRSILIG